MSSITQLINRLTRNPVILNTGAIIVIGGLNALSRLIMLLSIASFFNPNIFGQVIFAISTTEIGKVIAGGGISTVAIRQFATSESEEAKSLLAGGLAIVRVTLIALVYLGLAAFYLLTQRDFQTVIGLIVGLQVITSLWISYSMDYFQAQLASVRAILPTLLTNMAMVFSVWLLAWKTTSIIAVLAMIPTFEMINGALIFRIYRRHVRPQFRSVPLSLILYLLRNCAPIITTGIMVTIYTRLDVFVLSSFFDDAIVGFYGLAFRLTEPFLLIAAALGGSIFSRASFLLSSPTYASKVWPFLTRYSTVLSIYGLVTSAGLTFICPPLIDLLLPEYIESIPILRILAAALFVRILNVGTTSVINAYGHYGVIMRIAAFNLLFISILIVLLVPQFGALGAALSLLTTEAINCIIQVVVFRHLFISYRRRRHTIF